MFVPDRCPFFAIRLDFTSLEAELSRLINPDAAGTQRTRLSKSIVLALRELMRQPEPNEAAHDLAAFIALSLLEIRDGVEVSVIAWEKRDYWIKADRFRMDWEWTGRLGKGMSDAVLGGDWAQVALISAQIGQKLNTIKIAEKHRLGTPWVGAWKRLKEENVSAG